MSSRSAAIQTDPLLVSSTPRPALQRDCSFTDSSSSSWRQVLSWAALFVAVGVASLRMSIFEYGRFVGSRTKYNEFFDWLFPRLTGNLQTVATVCLPIHIVCAPIALFGGMFQLALGALLTSLKKEQQAATRRVLHHVHRYWGYVLLAANVGGLLPAYGLAFAAAPNKGWIECINLLFLATYTGYCVSMGAYHVMIKHQIEVHKHFMLRTQAGWFVFVTYRWAVYPTKGNYLVASGAMLTTFLLAEILIARTR